MSVVHTPLPCSPWCGWNFLHHRREQMGTSPTLGTPSSPGDLRCVPPPPFSRPDQTGTSGPGHQTHKMKRHDYSFNG